MNIDNLNHRLIQAQSGLTYYALSLTNDEDSAKDLVQETFLKVLSNTEKYTNDTNFNAWLFTILKNTFINTFNKLSTKKTIRDTSDDEYILRNTRYDAETPDSVLGNSEIVHALESLEDDYKIPFTSFVNGYKYHEIAEMMNLPIGTVKSRIYFARKKLMDVLTDFR
ncbi:MAG: sigma-70 family RNA polymerase sigma factor [Bacteroidales bacterium]|nr:sigma-70 family RNA polymerase sigma factor [Bacteroidales bacterium]HOY38872.1 sigma-70 family RNA polymerase sigma factor [Bacteroidales bacterium]HQP04726.1 sigma-70 family RNA polymerase sigma factor [Bacteroidales bacterium]